LFFCSWRIENTQHDGDPDVPLDLQHMLLINTKEASHHHQHHSESAIITDILA
jgi:hypothetical protein